MINYFCLSAVVSQVHFAAFNPYTGNIHYQPSFVWRWRKQAFAIILSKRLKELSSLIESSRGLTSSQLHLAGANFAVIYTTTVKYFKIAATHCTQAANKCFQCYFETIKSALAAISLANTLCKLSANLHHP